MNTVRILKIVRNTWTENNSVDMQRKYFHKIYKDPTCIANMPGPELCNNSEHATGKTTSIMVMFCWPFARFDFQFILCLRLLVRIIILFSSRAFVA